METNKSSKFRMIPVSKERTTYFLGVVPDDQALAVLLKMAYNEGFCAGTHPQNVASTAWKASYVKKNLVDNG